MTVAELIKKLEKMPQDYIVRFGEFNQDLRFVEINEYKERVELY